MTRDNVLPTGACLLSVSPCCGVHQSSVWSNVVGSGRCRRFALVPSSYRSHGPFHDILVSQFAYSPAVHVYIDAWRSGLCALEPHWKEFTEVRYTSAEPSILYLISTRTSSTSRARQCSRSGATFFILARRIGCPSGICVFSHRQHQCGSMGIQPSEPPPNRAAIQRL